MPKLAVNNSLSQKYVINLFIHNCKWHCVFNKNMLLLNVSIAGQFHTFTFKMNCSTLAASTSSAVVKTQGYCTGGLRFESHTVTTQIYENFFFSCSFTEMYDLHKVVKIENGPTSHNPRI